MQERERNRVRGVRVAHHWQGLAISYWTLETVSLVLLILRLHLMIVLMHSQGLESTSNAQALVLLMSMHRR